MTNQVLPLQGQATCGYCDDRLTLQSGGDWKCERCKPGLAAVRTPEDWIAFHREAARERRRRVRR